jgi:hypothetical protein
MDVEFVPEATERVQKGGVGGGRGHTGRGRGSHHSSQKANISQLPRSGVDSIPRLTYGLNSNFTLWLERITTHAVLTYDSNAMFFYTGVYTEYPMAQLGVGYAAEDIDPENDPGGILRDTIARENAVAISDRSLAVRHKLAIYTLVWDTVSSESQEAVLTRAADQPLEPGDYERLQARNDPLLLLQYMRSTHLLLATGATLFDQQAA